MRVSRHRADTGSRHPARMMALMPGHSSARSGLRARASIPPTHIRIGLMGFGKAGRAVAAVVLQRRGFILEWVAQRSPNVQGATAADLLGVDAIGRGRLVSTATQDAGELLHRHPVDVIVDFSSSSGPDYYGDAAAARGVAIVCAVSHFDRDMDAPFDRWASTSPVLWSPNITLGINFLLLAARALRAIEPDADVEIVEEHFRDKRELSGTARRLAATMGIDDECIKSLRAGEIVGNHEVLFGLRHQNVRLRHESITREAFGDGALYAARHLARRPPGRYMMEDLLLSSMRHADSGPMLFGEPRRNAS